jgi:hypothetical protein
MLVAATLNGASNRQPAASIEQPASSLGLFGAIILNKIFMLVKSDLCNVRVFCVIGR